MKHQILVGNIGTVRDTDSHKEALSAFREYKAQSKEGYGRASGEPVTWLQDGEIFISAKPMKTRFKEIKLRQQFTFGGTLWEKRSSRTANPVGSAWVFYFKMWEIVNAADK